MYVRAVVISMLVVLMARVFSFAQDILRFIPPDLVFAFQLSIPNILYTPPIIELVLTFEFTVRVKLGFNLDTQGIREAIEQQAPLKALNSFALIDSFDGVDEAMITATASITISIEFSAAIIKAGASGTLGVEVTIDLFDAYPETSRGLVRPFELLSIGSSPLDWFEISIRIYLTLRVYVKIGLYIGFIKITLFKFEYEVTITIWEKSWTPSVPPKSGEVDSSGTLNLNAGSASDANRLECTNMAGTIGQENIECIYGDQFQTFYDAKTVKASGAGDILLRGLRSPVDLTNFSVWNVTLDYLSAGVNVIADNTIIIQAQEIVAGDFIMKFGGMSGSGLLLLPQPEQAFLTTTFTGQCDSSWVLSGHSNVIVMADLIAQNCSILSYGGNVTKAKLTIDFGLSDGRACQDGNEVVLDTYFTIPYCPDANTTDSDKGQFTRATISRPDLDDEVTILVDKVFTDITIQMSKCEDSVRVSRTVKIDGMISIFTGGDNDEIYLGNGMDGLDTLYKSILIRGGAGKDRLRIDDSGSDKVKTGGKVTAGSVVGLLNGVTTDKPEDIDYSGIETIEILSVSYICE
jgi:hypothetical protein